MARTRSPDFENVQSFIQERTAILFSSRGYAATSISEIAAACECSKSRLYHYFDSKEAILSEMLTQHVDKVLAGCRRAIGTKGDPVERFNALVTTFLDIYLVSREKHIVLLTCMDFLPDPKRREVLRKQHTMIELLGNLLAEIRPPAKGESSDQSVNAMLFFGMINWTYTWYDPEGNMSESQLAERITELFLRGYIH